MFSFFNGQAQRMEEQDQFAIESYKRSQAAVSEGKFTDEIIPVSIPQKKGEPIIFSKDEEPFNVKFDKIRQFHGGVNTKYLKILYLIQSLSLQ